MNPVKNKIGSSWKRIDELLGLAAAYVTQNPI